MKKILFGTAILMSMQLMAQDSTGSLTISGYAEAYYQYDFNKPSDNNRPGFIYSHNRHNEFNLNLGFIKANYTAARVRANLALAAGTYMNANYAAEPGVLKNIYEANAGVKLSKNKNLWLDAGIMPSHIGFESAVSKDCWNMTRSILADNSPYFEAGAKITYTSHNGKWLVSGMALNGWQRITRVNGNSLMSWGTQIQYKPSDKFLLNYSTFIGTDKPDSARLSRLFHNIYGIFNVTDKFGITAGFDIGTEEKFPGSDDKNTWYSPVLILKYTFHNKWAIAVRGEYYSDEDGVVIATGTLNGFKTTGFSLNIDYSPMKNFVVRLEARNLSSKDEIFIKPSGITNNNTFITSSIAVSF
ncbi:MAG: porin [Chitinophagaceae bacterium]|nr:porin [Chitinophagaceae bacterium]MBK9466011.1 porin [Chitinophagaceae bacterium]MBP6232615.1 porin [Chitinophagaceae bacterium]